MCHSREGGNPWGLNSCDCRMDSRLRGNDKSRFGGYFKSVASLGKLKHITHTEIESILLWIFFKVLIVGFEYHLRM